MVMMNYSQTLDYLVSKLPMYQRIGAAAYKADLGNITQLCKILGHPERKFRSVHIAGTNGKGSVSHMIASILQTAGYKTGLHTSPHMKDFRERAKVNGNLVSKQYVKAFVNKNKKVFDKIQPSFFEMSVALAFHYFAQQKVEVAVIETGLGGRLDSTNILQPVVSVVTNISFDHMYLLGDTLEKIAREKAGIIKINTPAIIGESQKKTKKVFVEEAKIKKSLLLFADQEMLVKNVKTGKQRQRFDVYQKNKLLYKNIACDLLGVYQRKNILTVLATVVQLQKMALTSGKNIFTRGLLMLLTIPDFWEGGRLFLKNL